MKTQVNKRIEFKKNVVTELNESTLRLINGGSDTGFEGEEDLPPLSRWTSKLCTGINV